MIFHVDIDAFFASVEQVRDPALRGRPVIVGGRPTDRSVVASASYEARAAGVRTAMPIAQAYRICPHGVFLRGTYSHYRRAADQVLGMCGRFTPVVESTSLDDVYLDMRGTERLWGSPLVAAALLRDQVAAATGLHVTIGIGSNRLIARVATDLAKPNGVAWVWPGCEAAFLAPMPVSALPGVGRRTTAELTRIGVETIGDLSRLPARLLRQRFGVVGEQLARRAGGADDRAVVAGGLERRSISRETSFEHDEPDRDAARAMLCYLTERAGWTLRDSGLLCRAVSVKVRYADFTTMAGTTSLADPGDGDRELFASADALFTRLDTRRQALRLVGVTLERLFAARHRQLSLYQDCRGAVRPGLMAAQDAIRRRYGFGCLLTGRSIELLRTHRGDADGFKLRTPCLSR